MGGLETSPAIENYAKAIYALSERGAGSPVGTSAIAERLGVSAPSATAMIKRLVELDLASHQPYRGVSLTERGQAVALEVLRHHRLLELFLAETFGMSWDRVHDEAEVLEHAISEELEELIAEKLGHPLFDPHGDPIPARDGVMAGRSTRALAELEKGERGMFVRVSDSDPEMLRYLSSLGIEPGRHCLVTDRQPFDGPLFVRFFHAGTEPSDQVIGRGLALAMRVIDHDGVDASPCAGDPDLAVSVAANGRTK